jgi:hypothetical protein
MVHREFPINTSKRASGRVFARFCACFHANSRPFLCANSQWAVVSDQWSVGGRQFAATSWLLPLALYQGLASAKPKIAHAFSRNQVRGEAAPKPAPQIPIERSANVPRGRIDGPLPISRPTGINRFLDE